MMEALSDIVLWCRFRLFIVRLVVHLLKCGSARFYKS